MRLPDRPGLGVLVSIRDAGASRGAPVVGVTMPTDSDATARFAVANVLAKPLRADEVATAKVMVVDDEAMARDLMQATLRAIGIDAVGAAGADPRSHDARLQRLRNAGRFAALAGLA
jgi:DNA-binding response OmpR family regulator